MASAEVSAILAETAPEGPRAVPSEPAASGTFRRSLSPFASAVTATVASVLPPDDTS
jgi:hypothetical protein